MRLVSEYPERDTCLAQGLEPDFEDRSDYPLVSSFWHNNLCLLKRLSCLDGSPAPLSRRGSHVGACCAPSGARNRHPS